MDRKRKARTFPPVGFQLHLWTKNSKHASGQSRKQKANQVGGRAGRSPMP